MTLRGRVLAVCALVAVASCALSFGVAVVLVRNRIASQRLTALRADASVLALVGGAPGALAAGQHVYRMGSGTPTAAARPGQCRDPRSYPVRQRRGHDLRRLPGRCSTWPGSAPRAGSCSCASRSLAFAEWRPFLVSLGLAALGGVLVAVALSTLLARRLTRPIGALAAATERVAAGELDVAVPVQGEDELAGLGRAFNAMSDELGRARASQRRFLESVSHELRTPLTAIRGWGEGLEEGAVAPAEAGRVISDEARRLERLVVDLVELGRFGRDGFAVGREPSRSGRGGPRFGQRAIRSARGRAWRRAARRRGWGPGGRARRRRSPAADHRQPDRERAAPHAGRRCGHGDRGTGRLIVSDSGPGTRRRGSFPRV